MGVNKPSISVFKSLFIHKILVHPYKSEKFQKFRKKLKKSEKNPNKPKNYFEDLKCVHPIREWTTPRLSPNKRREIQRPSPGQWKGLPCRFLAGLLTLKSPVSLGRTRRHIDMFAVPMAAADSRLYPCRNSRRVAIVLDVDLLTCQITSRRPFCSSASSHRVVHLRAALRRRRDATRSRWGLTAFVIGSAGWWSDISH